MSGLTCCCSIVSVVCIWYIDFLPPHCLGSLAIILVGMSTVSVGNVCFHTWLTSPMLRTHTLSDVVNRVFLSVMSQMLNFFLDCFYQLRQYVTPQDDMLGSQNGYSQKWRVTNAMGEDSNATYDKPMEPACVTYPSISEQPDVRMLKPRGRETESIWTSGETIKGTLGKPRHPLFNFVFGVENFQSLEVCPSVGSIQTVFGGAKSDRSDFVRFVRTRSSENSGQIINCSCFCGIFPCIVNFWNNFF